MKVAFLLLVSTTLAGAWMTQEKDPKPLSVGQRAPAFRLNDHSGKAVSIGGESDTWTVLAFYPKAATPG